MCRKKRFLNTIILISTSVFILINNFSGIGSVFAGDILESGKKLYSEHNEELIIRDFFNDRRGGIFVDIGCADYMGASTTYYLEKYLGWSGIGVDALADWEAGYIKNRPNTKFYNFIITDHFGTTESFYKSGDNLYLSSIYKSYVDWAAKEKKRPKSTYTMIYIPTITLTKLLKENGLTKIDFLSIDIEGSEPAALAGFDIDNFKPKLVCIEILNNSSKIMEYFTRHGYERIEKYLKYDTQNWYFKPIGRPAPRRWRGRQNLLIRLEGQIWLDNKKVCGIFINNIT